MNLNQLQAKLLQVARQNPPSDHVPYAFEKRIMANLTRPVIDGWALWGNALWRGAMACVVAVSLVSGWSYLTASSDSADLSQDFEDTVFAAVDVTPDTDEDTW